MRGVICLVGLAWTALMLQGQSADSIRLWPGEAPGALGTEEKDVPTLTPFLPGPELASGAAIVICPGGGYGALAGHEGKDYAVWLNEQGIAGFVLKYRLGSDGYRHPRMLEDVSRALRTVRARAAEWNLDPNRIGVMGSSAGGHLAATLLTQFDAGNPGASDPIERVSSRPDLGILCYPVITMGEHTHAGSKRNLLGESPDAEWVEKLSAELQVTPATPPTFLWHTVEDKGVVVENSLLFASALREAGVPFELHVFEKGRHGIGLANGHPWTHNCIFWLRERGFLKGE